MDEFDERIRFPLRGWRKKIGLTQEQAAARFDTTEATLSRIESGHNRPSTVLEDRICRITGLSRDEIAKPRLDREAEEAKRAGAVRHATEAGA